MHTCTHAYARNRVQLAVFDRDWKQAALGTCSASVATLLDARGA